jgi:hypothetical protein
MTSAQPIASHRPSCTAEFVVRSKPQGSSSSTTQHSEPALVTFGFGGPKDHRPNPLQRFGSQQAWYMWWAQRDSRHLSHHWRRWTGSALGCPDGNVPGGEWDTSNAERP